MGTKKTHNKNKDGDYTSGNVDRICVKKKCNFTSKAGVISPVAVDFHNLNIY